MNMPAGPGPKPKSWTLSLKEAGDEHGHGGHDAHGAGPFQSKRLPPEFAPLYAHVRAELDAKRFDPKLIVICRKMVDSLLNALEKRHKNRLSPSPAVGGGTGGARDSRPAKAAETPRLFEPRPDPSPLSFGGAAEAGSMRSIATEPQARKSGTLARLRALVKARVLLPGVLAKAKGLSLDPSEDISNLNEAAAEQHLSLARLIAEQGFEHADWDAPDEPDEKKKDSPIPGLVGLALIVLLLAVAFFWLTGGGGAQRFQPAPPASERPWVGPLD